MKNTGEALFITDFVMVLAACFVFDLYTALYSFVGRRSRASSSMPPSSR